MSDSGRFQSNIEPPPPIDLAAVAGQQLYQMNRYSTENLHSVKQMISQDKNSKSISQLLIQNASSQETSMK